MYIFRKSLALAFAMVGLIAISAKAADAVVPPKTTKPATAKEAPTMPIMPTMQFPMPSKKEHAPNTMTESISREAKTSILQSMMMANPLSIRESIAMMVSKVKVKSDVKFEDAITSMKLRANQHNFKFVGSSPLSKDVEAMTGKPSPRVEVLSFCDSVVARAMLDYAPELIAFLPCRIAVLEDANKEIWIVSLDWDISWMQYSKNLNNMDDKLVKEAVRIRKIIDDMMQAGANGDL